VKVAAAVQFHPALGDVEGNLRRLEAAVESVQADLIVLPELALSGYLLGSDDEAAALAQRPDAALFGGLAELARAKPATVVVGFAELSDAGVYNSSLLIEPSGERSVYRKVHLFSGEKETFTPGDRPPHVVDVGWARLGMMICFDWIFPELARTLALSGADVLCHATNLVLPYCQNAMVTRCIENRVYAVVANRVGREARGGVDLSFTGGSEIVAPGGEILAKAGPDDEEIVTAPIDVAAAREKRVTPANDLFIDRRPDLYGLD